MFDRIKEMMSASLGDTPERPGEHGHAIELATAVLLAEVARADRSIEDGELSDLVALLSRHLHLSEDEAYELAGSGISEAEAAISLHAFTRSLHTSLSESDKLEVVELLWRVALADGVLDAEEDYTVRKIADLLYARRADIIRLRNKVWDEVDGS